MTDYYKEKREAYVLIDKMISDKEPISSIYYRINTKYGFTKKFVDERIEMLKEVVGYGKKDD